MQRIIFVKGGKIKLCANLFTWICFKNIFKKDWNSEQDKLKPIVKNADLTLSLYTSVDDFEQLSEDEKEEYKLALQDKALQIEFNHNTMYSMAVAGGFDGTKEDFFNSINEFDLMTDSELLKTYDELLEEFVIKTNSSGKSEKGNWDLTTHLLWAIKRLGLGEFEIKNLSLQQIFDLLFIDDELTTGAAKQAKTLAEKKELSKRLNKK